MAGQDSVGRLSEGEWRLMHAVWTAARQGPATARQIEAALGDERTWAYTTVKTMLERLVTKGVLTRRRQGLTVEYQPRLSRQDAQRAELENFTAGVFEGRPEPLVHHLLRAERLSARDRKALRGLLKKAGLDPGPADARGP